MTLFVSLTSTIYNSYVLLSDQLIGDNGIVQGISDSVISAFVNMSIGVSSTSKSIISSVVDTFNSDSWKKIGRFIIVGIIAGLDENRNKLLIRIRDIARGAVSIVQAELGIKSPSVIFKEIGANVVEGFNAGIDRTVLSVPNIIGMARDIAEKSAKTGELAASKIKAGLSQATQALRANFEQVVKIADTQGGDAAAAFIERFVDLKGLSIGSGEQKRAFTHALYDLVTSSINIMDKDIQNFKDGIGISLKAITNQADEVVTKFKTKTEEVRSQTNSTRNNLEDIFKKPITDNVLDDLHNKLLNGTKFSDDVASKIKIAYLGQQKLNGALKDSLTLEGYIKEIKDKQTLVNDTLGTQQHQQTTAVQDTENTAVALLDSLKLGINSTVPEVLASLSNMSDQMIQRLKDALQMHSPSQVFIDIGKNIGIGLKDGIIQSTRDIGNLGMIAINNLQYGVNSAIMSPINNLQPSLASVNNKLVPANIIIHNTINNGMDMATAEQRILKVVTKAVSR